MAKIQPWIAVLGALVLGGCASARGALIGAASGAAVGAGTGWLVSDEDLLGSSTSEASGNISLQPGPTIGAGALLGGVFGGIVGAMFGALGEDPYSDEPPPAEAQPQARRLAPSAF